MPPPARSCDRMLGLHAHAPHDTSRTSARGSCGALLSALARLIHRRCRQMRLAAGLACIRSVSPRAHAIAHTTAHTGTCIGAHTCARLLMSTSATSHKHTAPLSHALGLAHLCAHVHMHTARHTASHTQTGYHRKDTPRHTHAHTCTHVRTRSCLHAHTHAHENTQRQKRTCAHSNAHTYTHTLV